ncbi:MAG: serine/threonine protein kinase, partial [Nitrososphaeria archaeon]|nr:serine/threonine protein kinase [Nitrososphaeria archaeon]
MVKTVALGRLGEEGYGQVICYPRCETGELAKRLSEMRELGVKALSFRGEKRIGNIRVLGKGCVGIVVLAQTETGRAALKIRRTDADRAGMKREAEMLRIANGVEVGPKLLGFTENLLMMKFVDGILLPGWIETLEEKEGANLRVGRVLRDVLEQCWRLDEAGLDHGELSRASKHIII